MYVLKATFREIIWYFRKFSGLVNGSEIVYCCLLVESSWTVYFFQDSINFASNKVSHRMSTQGKMYQHLNCEGCTRFSCLYKLDFDTLLQKLPRLLFILKKWLLHITCLLRNIQTGKILLHHSHWYYFQFSMLIFVMV